MYVLLTILFLLLLILSYILFASFTLEINSVSRIFLVKFNFLASAGIYLQDDSVLVRIKTVFRQWEFDLLNQFNKNSTGVRKAERSSPPRKQSAFLKKPGMIRKLQNVLLSFRLNNFLVSIDTGSMPANGILYPCFQLIRLYSGKDLSINFRGENIIVIKINNTIARMLWAYFRS